MNTIAVIGAGYVGLVTGVGLAHKGNRVIMVEIDPEKRRMLLQGKVPFYEPGLDTLLLQVIDQGLLLFESTIKEGLQHNPDILFSCVGTPSLPSGDANLSYVWAVAQEIGALITAPILVINKSTVPVGTTRSIKRIINNAIHDRGLSFTCPVASNPEFLKEGDALSDFLRPDRVVVGIESDASYQKLYDMYKPFISSPDNFISMGLESAELTKYAANAMLATRISFMNQMAILADLVGADIDHVKMGIAKDPRIGPHFLHAGIGYGGSCFPKDVKALIAMGKDRHFPMTLMQEVDNINHFQRIWFINQLFSYYGIALENKTVGLWGLSFKPETDDIRCAPSLDIIDELLQRGARIIAYDPVAMPNVVQKYGTSVTFAKNAHDVLMQSDSLVIVTEWPEFRATQAEDFLLLRDKTVFDGRNCFNPLTMKSFGLTYFCVGRNNNAKYADEPELVQKHESSSCSTI
jgi:UDPglucose 6-dehydrogenase